MFKFSQFFEKRTHNSADSPGANFPLHLVFWAALTPTLLGVFCAVFIAPPILSPDTANGLLAWYHFMEGGSWNTVRAIDPSNIARSIEYPVSWWAPGQYVPLGILHSIGISLGTGIIIVSAFFALLFGGGISALAFVMGSPRRAIPWITLSACASYHVLLSFGFFMGGELAQITVWPWAVFLAWLLQKRIMVFIAVLSIILIIGALGKHSFAIYALALLFFIWSESLRKWVRRGGVLSYWSKIWPMTLALCVVGFLFTLGRYLLLDTSRTPGAQGELSPGFLISWGYSFCGPLLGVSGVDKIVEYIFCHGAVLDSGTLWRRAGLPLSIMSLLALVFYFWLFIKGRLIDRLAGGVSLMTGCVFFILLWRGGVISLESRHYQPAAMLFILVLGSRVLDSNRLVSVGSRMLIGFIIFFSCVSLVRRHVEMRLTHSNSYYSNSEHMTLVGMPQPVQREVEALAGLGHSIIAMYSPAQGNAIYKFLNPTSRLFLMDNVTEYPPVVARYGRVSHIFIIFPNREWDQHQAQCVRKSFRDYCTDEWTCYRLGGWVILQAGDTVLPGRFQKA